MSHWDKEYEKWASVERHPVMGSEKVDKEEIKRREVIEEALTPHMVKLEAAKKILDLGAGAGTGMYLSEELAGKVIAIDITHKLLKYNYAKSKVQADMDLGYEGLSLPLQAESVEAVTSFFLMRYLHKHPHFVTEIARVMCKGGLVLVMDYDSIGYYKEVREFNADELAKELVKAGLINIKIKRVYTEVVADEASVEEKRLSLLSAIKG